MRDRDDTNAKTKTHTQSFGITQPNRGVVQAAASLPLDADGLCVPSVNGWGGNCQVCLCTLRMIAERSEASPCRRQSPLPRARPAAQGHARRFQLVEIFDFRFDEDLRRRRRCSISKKKYHMCWCVYDCGGKLKQLNDTSTRMQRVKSMNGNFSQNYEHQTVAQRKEGKPLLHKHTMPDTKTFEGNWPANKTQ